MFKTNIPEFYAATLVVKINCIFYLFDNWLLFKHVEKIFHIHLRLINLSKQSAHVKQWARELQEKSLNHHKVTWSQKSS
jgi:hypothetical protein